MSDKDCSEKGRTTASRGDGKISVLTLSGVQFQLEGGLSGQYDKDDTKRRHFAQEFNFRIDQDTEEFVIRIRRKPEAAARQGHTNVAVKIEGGLTQQPDGRVVFDGGVGNSSGTGASTFGLSFKISHEKSSSDSVDEGEEEEEPEEKEVAFFDHLQHKLHLDPVNVYKETPGATCDACMEPHLHKAKWVYRCPVAACDYAVHAACAQLPRTIRHPSHHQHPAKLLKVPPGSLGRQCDACKGDIHHGLHYHCAKWDFDAHPVCPATEHRKAEQQLSEEEQVLAAERELAAARVRYRLEKQGQDAALELLDPPGTRYYYTKSLDCSSLI